jgi:hypothetical protein
MQVAVSNSLSNVSSMQNVVSNHISDFVSAIVAAQTKWQSDGAQLDTYSEIIIAISDMLTILSDGFV